MAMEGAADVDDALVGWLLWVVESMEGGGGLLDLGFLGMLQDEEPNPLPLLLSLMMDSAKDLSDD